MLAYICRSPTFGHISLGLPSVCAILVCRCPSDFFAFPRASCGWITSDLLLGSVGDILLMRGHHLNLLLPIALPVALSLGPSDRYIPDLIKLCLSCFVSTIVNICLPVRARVQVSLW